MFIVTTSLLVCACLVPQGAAGATADTTSARSASSAFGFGLGRFSVASSPADSQAIAASCAESLNTSFGGAAANGSISTAAVVDCFSLADVAAGDWVRIGLVRGTGSSASPIWTVVDGTGNPICQAFSSGDCQLSGAGGWSVQISDYYSANSFSYSIAARRLTNPQGCSALGEPTSFSFTAPRLDGSIDGVLATKCYTFSRAVGDADGAYWFRAIRTSGTMTARWRVHGPSGSQECAGSGGDYQRCSLLASGQFALVVDDQSDTNTGSFFATAKRTTSPVGCSAPATLAFGSGSITGAVSAAGEVDCYSLADVTAGDWVRIGFAPSTGSSAAPRWTLVDGAGNPVCTQYYNSSDCQLTGASGWSLLIYEYGANTYSYSLAAYRLTDPEGCGSLGAPAAWSFAAPRIDGSIDGVLGAKCYTFSRAPGEQDGAYWFRAMRTSGTMSARWRVYGPSGSQECLSNGVDYQRCPLLASGQFTLVVDDQSDTNTGSFLLTAKRTTVPTGCTALASVAFGADPVGGNLSSGGEIDCYTLTDVSAGDAVRIAFTRSGGSGGSPRWTVVDNAGNIVCTQYYYAADCQLTGAGAWSLLVFDYGPDTFSYSIAARRLSNPQGCSSLGAPEVWSFTAPRINGVIDGALDAECYTFSRAVGEEDGGYWFRAMRTSGAMAARWRVYGPSGAQECAGSGGDYQRCQLLASGQFVLVVDDESDVNTGTFWLTPRRSTSRTGCSTLPSIAFGTAPVTGNLSTGGEIDCYTLAASSGDILTFTATGSAERLSVIDAEGQQRCYQATQCTIEGDGPFALLVYAYGTATGGYRFQGACENVPCGQSDTAVTDAVPNRVGQGEFTSTVLRGRDLELLASAKLVRGTQTVEGELQPAAPDGRAVDVRFDLADAALGAWTLEATFIDGTVRTLPNAVVVEAVRPATIGVQILGREVFRAGAPTTITVEVSNSGNVDAIAVPVMLRGLPADATITPTFAMHTPTGTAQSIEIDEVPFDPSLHTVTDEGEIFVPLLVARVQARRSVRLEYVVNVPRAIDVALRASAGACLGGARPSAAASGRVRADDPDYDCMAAIGNVMLDLVPGAACTNRVGQSVIASKAALDGMQTAASGEFAIDTGSAISWGLTIAECATEVIPPLAIAKRFVKVVSNGFDALSAVSDCLLMPASSTLSQRAVTSFDPNDILGPVGAGEQRYIAGDVPLEYRVLFENLPAATAPAQRVVITNQLNASLFDTSSLLFEEIRFGETIYRLPYASPTIDEVLDLRPSQNMLVHVTAGVTPGGQVHWELQAIDPETLAPPEDPLAGFLPPNTVSPEGEGYVAYRVNLKNLPSGQVVSNQASIVFDTNAPIATPVWTNTIDKQAPAPSVSAAGASDPAQAVITWSGTDDAAGITFWEVQASKDGGPFVIWHNAEAAGSKVFAAQESARYAFRAVARDGAGNEAQSAQSAVTLRVGGSTPPPPVAPPPVAPPPATPPAPPPAPTDVVAPTVRLGGSTIQRLGKTVFVDVTCVNENCDARLTGKALVPRIGMTNAKTYTIKKAMKLKKASRVRVKLTLSAVAIKAIRRALKARKRVSVRLAIVATDAGKNKRTLSRVLKLKL